MDASQLQRQIAFNSKEIHLQHGRLRYFKRETRRSFEIGRMDLRKEWLKEVSKTNEKIATLVALQKALKAELHNVSWWTGLKNDYSFDGTIEDFIKTVRRIPVP